MTSRHRRPRSGIPWPVINRLAQLNVAIALAIGAMIRLSMEFSATPDDRPDPLMVIGFFVVMAIALWLIVRFRRELRELRVRWHRIVAAVVTFSVQFAVLEILILFVVDA